LKKTAFLFPGQGSQNLGMVHDLYQEYDIVRELFDMAEEISKISLARICFKGPMEELIKTVNLQPAVTVANLALLRVVEKEGASFDITAGHSLGEYSSLKASGVISAEDTFRIVHRRGVLMHREAEKNKGSMCVVIGLSLEVINELVERLRVGIPNGKGGLSVANHNAETQIVVSGDQSSIKQLAAEVKVAGGRALPLKVSGAWHSPLIKGAEKEFCEFLGTFAFKQPQKPIIFNVKADTENNPDMIRENMVKQLCSPVRWYETVDRLKDENVEIFVELGPGKVLTGLTNKIMPKDYPFKIYSVNNMKTLEIFFKDVI
jgi:[acyl-carrier-protein] S-malonyltransferase